MISIIASLSDHAVVALLQPEIARRLGLFRNVEVAEHVFDYLWEHPEHVDFVIVDKSNLDLQDLSVCAGNRPTTRFIVVDNAERDVELEASNVTFLNDLEKLYQTVVSVFEQDD